MIRITRISILQIYFVHNIVAYNECKISAVQMHECLEQDISYVEMLIHNVASTVIYIIVTIVVIY